MTQEVPLNETPAQKEEQLILELANCETALSKDPDNADLLFTKGFLLNQLGRFEDAVSILEKAVDESPSVRKYMQLGHAYTQIEKYKKALEVYNLLLEFDDNNDEAHNCRGFVLSLMGNHKDAIAEYKKAIGLNENYTDARLNLGYSLDELGKHADAISEYETIISLNPRDCCAYLNKGCSLSAIGKNKEALIEFDHSLSIRPNDAFAHFMKGNVHHVCGELENAFDEFDQAVKLDENYIEAHYYRAEVAKLMGKEKEAISDYSAILSRTPDDSKILMERGKLYENNGDYESAIKDFTSILSKTPNDPSLLSRRGELYEWLERYELAIDDYTTLLSNNQYDANIRLRRGKLYEKIEKYDLAIDDYAFLIPYESSLQLELGTIRLQRGKLYEKMGMHDEAASDFYTLINHHNLIDNGDRRPFLELAYCQYETGLYEEAESSLISFKKRYCKIDSPFDKYRFLKLRAKIHYSLKRYEEAFDAFEECIKSLNKLRFSESQNLLYKGYSDELVEIKNDIKLCLTYINIPNWLDVNDVPELVSQTKIRRNLEQYIKHDITLSNHEIFNWIGLNSCLSSNALDLLNRYGLIYAQKLIEHSVDFTSNKELFSGYIDYVVQTQDAQIREEVKEYVLSHDKKLIDNTD